MRKMAKKAYAPELSHRGNRYLDYLNFLACAPTQIFNLKADADGTVKFRLENISNFN